MLSAALSQVHPTVGFAVLLCLAAVAVCVTAMPVLRGAAAGVDPMTLRRAARAARAPHRPLLSLFNTGRRRIVALAGIGTLVAVFGFGSLGLVAFDSRIRGQNSAIAERHRLEGEIEAARAQTKEAERRASEALAARDEAHREEMLDQEARYQKRIEELKAEHQAEVNSLTLKFQEDLARQGETDELKNSVSSMQMQLLEQTNRTLTIELDRAKEIILDQAARIRALEEKLAEGN